MDKDLRIDSELLILALKKNECLWNKNKPEYHKKDLKEITWNNICAELVEDWDTLKDQERALKQLVLKKRWNNIRDYYKKDLALQMKLNIGKTAVKRKNYMFSKKLEFLKPFYMEQSTPNTTICVNDQEEEVEIREEDIKEETVEVYYSSSAEENEPPPMKKQTSKKDLSAHHNWTFPASNSSVREEEPTEVEELVEDDCDLLFLKSLAPDMKVLNRRQKIDFKLGILQLYKNIISQPEHGETDPFYKC